MNKPMDQQVTTDLDKYFSVIRDYLDGHISGVAILDLDDFLFDTKSPFLPYLKLLPTYEVFLTAINIYNPEEKAHFPLCDLIDDEELRPHAEKMLAELLGLQNNPDFPHSNE